VDASSLAFSTLVDNRPCIAWPVERSSTIVRCSELAYDLSRPIELFAFAINKPIVPRSAMGALFDSNAMKYIVHTFLFCILLVGFPDARAESLRCSGASAGAGDSRASVLYKCGQPTVADAYCEPVRVISAPAALPSAPSGTYVLGAHIPCRQVDEWIYDRGQGNLAATVIFHEGRVHSIRYGRLPGQANLSR
jgi:hypothetical protein